MHIVIYLVIRLHCLISVDTIDSMFLSWSYYSNSKSAELEEVRVSIYIKFTHDMLDTSPSDNIFFPIGESDSCCWKEALFPLIFLLWHSNFLPETLFKFFIQILEICILCSLGSNSIETAAWFLRQSFFHLSTLLAPAFLLLRQCVSHTALQKSSLICATKIANSERVRAFLMLNIKKWLKNSASLTVE